MKQEPLLWLYKEDLDELKKITGNPYKIVPTNRRKCFNDDIPLYTSPQYKELSDAEIEEWLDIYGLDMGDVYEITQVRFVQAVRAIIKSAEVLK